MKLILAIPKNDIDNTFEHQILFESEDDIFLKKKGDAYAESKGEEIWSWGGPILIGDEPVPIHTYRKWTMNLTDGTFLIIE
jgi:hypothetical protein